MMPALGETPRDGAWNNFFHRTQIYFLGQQETRFYTESEVGMVPGLVKSLLFGRAATDPLTLAVTAGILLAAAVAAGYLPARRASQLDPLVALRQE